MISLNASLALGEVQHDLEQLRDTLGELAGTPCNQVAAIITPYNVKAVAWFYGSSPDKVEVSAKSYVAARTMLVEQTGIEYPDMSGFEDEFGMRMCG